VRAGPGSPSIPLFRSPDVAGDGVDVRSRMTKRPSGPARRAPRRRSVPIFALVLALAGALALPAPVPAAEAGDTHPAWCDLDGDGRDELIVSRGRDRDGIAEVFEDGSALPASRPSARLVGDGYNAVNGERWPAVERRPDPVE